MRLRRAVAGNGLLRLYRVRYGHYYDGMMAITFIDVSCDGARVLAGDVKRGTSVFDVNEGQDVKITSICGDARFVTGITFRVYEGDACVVA